MAENLHRREAVYRVRRMISTPCLPGHVRKATPVDLYIAERDAVRLLAQRLESVKQQLAAMKGKRGT
jgi:hypothetical protein